jgi:uncharacterized protein
MRIPGVLNTTRQLAEVVIGSLITILLLESGGLTVWAKRLDVGAGRTEAVRTTSTLHKRLQPLGIENLRQNVLISLQKTGWSDDPASMPSDPSIKTNSSKLSLACNVIPPTPSTVPKAAHPLVAAVPQKITLTPLPPLQTGKIRVVALTGDSMMAVGLSEVLQRNAAQNKNLQMVKAFRSGTGLARPEVFDWMTEYPAMIGDTHPDTVIVSIGANDGQDFLEDEKPLKFGSPEWITVYQQRVQLFLDLLTAQGTHVIWVGLPPMKAPGYNARIALINRITYAVVNNTPNAVWWNPALYIGDANGQYRDFAPQQDGKVKRIRATDGIHMSNEGADLLSPALITWLDAAPPATPPPPTATAVTTASTTTNSAASQLDTE